MQKNLLLLTTVAFVLAFGTAARAQEDPNSHSAHHPDQQQSEQQPGSQTKPGSAGPGGMMGQGGMMGPGGMMGAGGMMGPGGMMSQRGMMARQMGQPGVMAPNVMIRVIFALTDSDGDGTISLTEFQAAHEKIFKAMDANKDGRLTLEEMQNFIRGGRSLPQ